MTDSQLQFPIILTVPRPQGQSALTKLTQAGVLCELTEPPPVLGALQTPDETGWSTFSKVAQPDLIGIKVLPDPTAGVRLPREVLEQMIYEHSHNE